MTSSDDFRSAFSGGPTDLNGGQAERAADAARERILDAADDAAVSAGQAAGRARASADKISGQANDQLNQAMNVAGQQLHSAAQQVRSIAPEGPVADLAGRTAEFLERGGSYLQSSDPGTALGDLEQLIRRRPLQALAVGLGIGFLIGRSGK